MKRLPSFDNYESPPNPDVEKILANWHLYPTSMQKRLHGEIEKAEKDFLAFQMTAFFERKLQVAKVMPYITNGRILAKHMMTILFRSTKIFGFHLVSHDEYWQMIDAMTAVLLHTEDDETEWIEIPD